MYNIGLPIGSYQNNFVKNAKCQELNFVLKLQLIISYLITYETIVNNISVFIWTTYKQPNNNFIKRNQILYNIILDSDKSKHFNTI